MLLSFNISDNVIHNTILGMLVIDGMSMIYNIKNGIMMADGLQGPNNMFAVDTKEAQYRLPETWHQAAYDKPITASTKSPGTWIGVLPSLAWIHQPVLPYLGIIVRPSTTPRSQKCARSSSGRRLRSKKSQPQPSPSDQAYKTSEHLEKPLLCRRY
jgi:hypothetical protein